jgi:hypothetical protein
VRDGKPVTNAVVAMSTVEREAGKHLHDFEAVTDAEGAFAILSVTPELDYYLFGKMASLGSAGSFPARRIKTGATGTTIDAGIIPLAAAHTLKGRVVLTDGERVPPKTRLYLGREDAWDYTEAMVADDGTFEVSGLPAESISLSVRMRGYKSSHKNPSLDWYNGGLVGRLEKDYDDFVILLEPGNWRYNEEMNDAPPEADRQPRELPLRSAKL